MKAVIISGGNSPSERLLNKELKNAQIIICADSGADCLYKYKILPSYLIGDFDSISDSALKYFKEKGSIIEEYPREKDFTDTELAIEKAIELDCSEIALLGCTGTRLDHFMGNLGLLLRLTKRKKKAYIVDDNNKIFIIDESKDIVGEHGKNFSLQAFDKTVKNLNIKNAKYELKNYDLNIGDPRTISNEFLSEKVKLTFDSGNLLIMYCKD